MGRKLALWAGRPYDNDNIFDSASPIDPDGRWAPFQALRRTLEASGGWCHTQDVCLREGLIPDAVLFLDIPSSPVETLLGGWSGRVKKFALLQECEVIAPRNWNISLHSQFDALFTWNPGLVDGVKYFRVNFSNAFPAAPAPLGERNGFCALIAAHKKNFHPLELYSERERSIRWFERFHPSELDLYGVGWDRYAFGGPRIVRALNRITPLTRMLGGRFPSYKGKLAAKRPALLDYKYSICYENARDIPGYVTEKIFDCLFSGCIPIYWGAPDIKLYVPEECFIDRRKFSSHEALYTYMKGMTPGEYASRLEVIARYLLGRDWYQFSDAYFGETIAGVIARE